MSLKLAVVISGNGSNLQAIIDQIEQGKLDASIVCVISNKADAYGLTRAQLAGIPTEIIANSSYQSREAFDQALAGALEQSRAELIVLAGFMRILSADFVKKFQGKMINIHPSLLPKFKGLNTHQRALDEGEKEHGASVHFVTEDLDDGPIIAQASVNIAENDSAESLAEKVRIEEHRLYPAAIQLIARGELRYQDGSLSYQGKKLEQPLQL